MDKISSQNDLSLIEFFSVNNNVSVKVQNQFDKLNKLAGTLMQSNKSLISFYNNEKFKIISSNNFEEDQYFEIHSKISDAFRSNSDRITYIANTSNKQFLIVPIYNLSQKVIGCFVIEVPFPFAINDTQSEFIGNLSEQITQLIKYNCFKDKLSNQLQKSKHLEKKLKATETILNYTNEITPLGILQTNLQGEIYNVNSKFKSIAGYYNVDAGCQLWYENIIPEDKQKVITLWENAVFNKQPFECKSKFIHENGTISIVQINASPIVKIDGDIKYLFFVTDITQKFREDEKTKKAKENEQFAIQQKEAFLTNMSHEIRTPMNAIVGFTNILHETTVDEKQHEYISLIKSAGENLLSIINDILDFSKIGSSKVVLTNQLFKVNDIKRNVFDLLKLKAEEKNLEFNFNVDASIPDQICGDVIHLNQVLINLANNAIKFTDKGFVNLNLENINETSDHIEIKFSVTDSGIGISKDAQDLIFERYFQAENTINKNYGGTGLGLNISRNLVEEMGGKITLQSEIGKGSTFSFALKLNKYNVNEDKIEIKQNINILSDKSINILVFEDNLLNKQLITHILNGFGFNPTIAENGLIGIDLLKKENFDLIIMDLDMPIMDGYKSTQIIRNELKLETPIMAMTAHTIVGEKEKCFSIGMNDFISKPVNKNELFEKICNLTFNRISLNTISENKISSTLNAGLNLEYLKSLSNGNHDFEKDMIEVFLKIVPGKVVELKNALNECNTDQIKRITHSLKGSIGIIGIPNALELLCKLEESPISESNYTFLNGIYEKFELTLFPFYSLLENELELKYRKSIAVY